LIDLIDRLRAVDIQCMHELVYGATNSSYSTQWNKIHDCSLDNWHWLTTPRTTGTACKKHVNRIGEKSGVTARTSATAERRTVRHVYIMVSEYTCIPAVRMGLHRISISLYMSVVFQPFVYTMSYFFVNASFGTINVSNL